MTVNSFSIESHHSNIHNSINIWDQYDFVTNIFREIGHIQDSIKYVIFCEF